VRCTLDFPSLWINSKQFETVLQRSGGPHGKTVYDVVFKIPQGCKLMVDAAVRLLSLANQLQRSTRRVRLEFEEGEEGTMGYLDRIGFFDHLLPEIEVSPDRPTVSRADIFYGTSFKLVEIAAINPADRSIAKNLPGRLTDVLVKGCHGRPDIKSLENAAFTVFAELIGNIFDHSSTELDGFAALQLYRRGGCLKVAVSDSGHGVLQTLRPALEKEKSKLAKLSDTDLFVEVVRKGLSRHGKNRGCGIKGSAEQALKYKAELDVRLPESRILLVPGQTGYRPNTAYCFDNLHLFWGTHLSFDFDLT